MNNFHHFIYLIISSRREIGRSLIRTCMKSQFFLHLIYISQQRFREGVKKHIFERTNPPSFYPVGLFTDIDFLIQIQNGLKQDFEKSTISKRIILCFKIFFIFYCFPKKQEVDLPPPASRNV